MSNDTEKDKKAYKLKLANMSDDDLRRQCNRYIWLSAYEFKNQRSAYHWMCDMCGDECQNRNKMYIYHEEHKKLAADADDGRY